MAELRKYKVIIGAVLLAIYAFIATPVQYCHLHNPVKKISSSQAAKKEMLSAAKYSNKATEVNCELCNHHYSIYSNGDTILYKVFKTALLSVQSFQAAEIPFAPYFNYTNKGPPLVARSITQIN